MQTKLTVQLLSYTPDADKLVSAAAKLCYSSSDIPTLLDGLTPEKVEEFLTRLLSMGHESPVEHASFTFGIEGVSRALLAQLTRHRIASFSVQSQRYVNMNGFDYVVPPEIEADDVSREAFHSAMAAAQQSYDQLQESLAARYIANGMDKRNAKTKANEDARFVLPNAATTKIVMTMNVRSLYNFFRLRCCVRAQWEINSLAREMLKEVRIVAPILFAKAGAPCVSGTCPEGEMGC